MVATSSSLGASSGTKRRANDSFRSPLKVVLQTKAFVTKLKSSLSASPHRSSQRACTSTGARAFACAATSWRMSMSSTPQLLLGHGPAVRAAAASTNWPLPEPKSMKRSVVLRLNARKRVSGVVISPYTPELPRPSRWQV